MKVLFLIDSLIEGGKERRMIELIKGLIKTRYIQLEVVIFSKIIDYPEIHDINVPLHIIERKPKKDPRVFFKLYMICKRFHPNIIHTWSSMTTILAFPSIKFLNIKLLNGSIANAPYNLKIWNKELFRAKLTFPFSDWIISNSKAGLKSFSVPKAKSTCIYNGFDFNRITKLKKAQDIKRKYGINTEYIIGKVASFTNRKDYDSFIKAAMIVMDTRDDVTFFAIGSGPNLEKIKNMVPDFYSDRIIFTGPIKDVESLINIFHIGILSTNNDIHGEGISNSIMEYMALSKPVIATEGGGTNEIVIDDITGILIPPKSPEILAEKIMFLLDYPEKSAQMGKAGYERIFNNFRLDKMTDIYYQLYKKLINK